MISGITILLCFQIAGELAARLLHLPISGSLCGMVALLSWLHLRGHINENLAKVCDSVLANMALLFVPAGVGAMRYAELFVNYWHAITLAIALGACVTLLTTAFTARALAAWNRPRSLDAGAPETRPTRY